MCSSNLFAITMFNVKKKKQVSGTILFLNLTHAHSKVFWPS